MARLTTHAAAEHNSSGLQLLSVQKAQRPVTMGAWWGVGLVMCILELAIFAIVGGAWWKLLGYW